MKQNDFKDRDEQAAWELLGRHKPIEPSFGFTERTLRRLAESPVETRPWFRQPAFRWALLGATAVALTVGGWVGYQRIQQSRRVQIYVKAQQADYLEDYDVIAFLDQLNGENAL